MKNKKVIIIVAIIAVIIGISTYYIVKRNIQKNREYEIEQISNYKYFVARENDKYGVINTQGNEIIQFKYEDVKIPNPEKDVFICYEGEKTVILNENGEQIFTQYNNIQPLRLKNISSDLMYEKTILKYEQDGKYGIIDFNGKQVTKAIYEEIDTLQFKEGELLVKENGKYGVINIKGATLVEANYDKIETDRFYDEENGYKDSGYIVSNTTAEGYRYGYVNIEGKQILETKYNDLYRIVDKKGKDIYLICAENGKYGVIKNGKKIIENEYQSLTYMQSNDTLIALKGKKYGVVSIEGKEIVPFEYQQIDISGEYIHATDTDGHIKIFDADGKETDINENVSIINIENTDYKIYIEYINEKTTYSIYNKQEKITKNEYAYIQYLYNNYFIVCDNDGNLGIIDDKENIKLDFNYSSMQKIDNTEMIQALNKNTKETEIYSKDIEKICELRDAIIENNEGYIKIYNDKEIKYISDEEKEVNNTEVLKNNKIFAKKSGNKWGFVDIQGNKIIDYKYERVTEINEYGFAGVQQDGKWGVINDAGQTIIEPTYKIDNYQPIFIGKYYKVIYGNGEVYYTK